MNRAGGSEAGGHPFSPRTALALVLFGAAVFVALLWMIGAGLATGSTNDGGSHAGGKGLTGYAGLAALLEKRGTMVNRLRSPARLDDPGLLVLTPPHRAEAEDIAQIVERRRYQGPTLLILPKWLAAPIPAAMRPPEARDGWVMLGGAVSPSWADGAGIGELDVGIAARAGQGAQWSGLGRSGRLAEPGKVQSLASPGIVPLVRDGTGQALAGYLDDEGWYPVLDRAAGRDVGGGADDGLYPVVVVAEPDLLNNYAMADRARAMLALALVQAATGGAQMPVNFDLTLNGHGRSANLLTLAFTPPFLAATLCLLIAALAVGWRAFLRFGPPRKAVRAIAFGKRALVANAAGLVRRTRRMHLVGAPYAAHVRERLQRRLALPRHADPVAADAAIDRAIAARRPEAPPFSALAGRLVAARRPQDVLRAAQELHALERTLTR